MAEKYSIRSRIKNYTRGLLAAGLLAANTLPLVGCATPNSIKERRYLGLEGKLNNATCTQVSVNDREAMVKAGIEVDFNNYKELIEGTASAATAFGYGMVSPLFKEFWTPSKPEKLEYNALTMVTSEGYQSGRKAETAGKWAFFVGLFTGLFANKGHGKHAPAPNAETQLPAAQETYQTAPRAEQNEQEDATPISPPPLPPPAPTSPAGGDKPNSGPVGQ